MAFSEKEIQDIERVMDGFIAERRPPEQVRAQVDLCYRISNQSVEIFELRANLSNPSEKYEESIAKATFVKTKNVWKVYWQRQDLKWHSYAPFPETPSLKEFTQVVAEDNHFCFFG